MTMPPAPTGWTRYLVKSTFGAGRDFKVLDADGSQVFSVDGKMGTRPKAEVRDAADATLYEVRGHLLGIPKKMAILDSAGVDVASLSAKVFSPIKTRMTLSMADGADWALEGSFIEKDYSVTSGGGPVMQISQKWVTVRDTYTLDVADGADPGLALAVLWAVDRWVERD